MSLPKELLDQLLSGYLDDALTADERVRVEQLLQSNAEVADELQQLRDLRRSLQVLSRVDSDIKLEKGFADRVLGAAVARAREEGLGDEHPLVRLAEQPSTSPSVVTATTNSWRMAAIMVGLAASIVVAVLVLRPKFGAGPELIAKSDSVPIDHQDVQTNPDTEARDAVIDSEKLVDDRQPSVDDVAAGPGRMEVESSTDSDVEPPGDASINRVDVAPPEGTSSPVASIAASGGSAIATDNDGNAGARETTEEPGLLTGSGAILVVEVQRTEAGRASGAVARAMSAANIAPASRKEVTEQIAGFVADNVDKNSDEASVLYLQVPGKQFDVFYQQLWADEAGIESVRMTIAMNAPFMKVVNSVRPDPTTVQHDGAAYELFSRNGVVDQLANELSQLPFPSADRHGAATSMLGSGPDIQAQVLVLVR